MTNEIIALLSRNDRAVNRAMVVLYRDAPANLSGKDKEDARYFSRWVETTGKPLTGNFLVRARALAIRYADILATLAEDNQATKAKLDKPTAFVLDRDGIFTIETVPGTNHCGTLPRFDIKYRVQCEAEANLDRRGFLIDQLLIDRYFQSISRAKVAVSCEVLAQDSMRGIKSVLLADNPSLVIRKLVVTLSPAPFAARMTCRL